MKSTVSSQNSTESSALNQDNEQGGFDLPDFPIVSAADELPDHPEPTFDQMLAHAMLLLALKGDDFYENRRKLMCPERFVM